MKIVILGPAWPYRGGIAAFDERLARQLQAEGHTVEMVTFTLQYPNFLFPGKTQYSEESAPSDLNISRNLNSCNPFNWISVGCDIARLQPDLLLVAYWLPFMAPALGTVIRMAKSKCKTMKCVAVLHNFLPHERRIGDKMFSHYFIGAVDGVVALSQSVCTEVAQFRPSLPCACSPHPLYDSFGESVSRDEALEFLHLDTSFRYLLFFGLIRDYKGLDLLLDAFAKMKTRAEVKLIVAGEFYGSGEKYLQQAKSLGINDSIIWDTKYVPDSEIKYYFCASDVVVQPYKTATQSGVTQIAYNFLKPMIVTRVGGLPEIVPDGKAGYVAEPNSDDIAEKMDKFVIQKVDFSEGLTEEKKKYQWSAMTKAILSL